MTTMFTPDHEWINIEDHEAAVVGITLHAQDALGDVVYVDLPEVGRTYAMGDVAGVVESVKAAADLYMPVSGEVVEVNEELRANPALANTDPMGNGWFFKVHVTNMMQFDELMDPPAYDKLLKSEIADMRNVSAGRGAGSITAAQFLQRFVKNDLPWAHIDIAGMAWGEGDATTPKGATAYGVRLVDRFVADSYES